MTPLPPPGQGPVQPPGFPPQPPRGGYAPPPPGYPVMMMPPQKQGGGLAKALLVTLATSIFGLSLMLNVWLLVIVGASQSESSDFKAIETPLVRNGGGDKSQKVAVVKLEGVIDDGMAKPLIQLLDHVQADADVRAMILEINSPGGGVTPSDELYARVLRFKKEKGIPVFISMNSLAASGGYYVAMAGDKLYASETTMTGSIGVLFQRYDLTGFGEKYGVKEDAIVSDGATYKTSGSPFKKLSEDETAYFKSLLNDARDTFKSRIKSGRPNLNAEKIDFAANGKIYSAKQAKTLGLIDQIGYLGDAVADISKVAGLTSPLVVRIERELSFGEKLFGGGQAKASLGAASVSVGGANVSIDRSVVDDVLRPRMMYLWQGQ